MKMILLSSLIDEGTSSVIIRLKGNPVYYTDNIQSGMCNDLTNKYDIVFFCNDQGYQLNFHQTILCFYGQELFAFYQFSTT